MTAIAKSMDGIGTPVINERQGAQPMRLFLRPKSMVGLFRALRRAALVDCSSNLLKPATLTIGTVGGSSQNINEDTPMSNPRKIIPLDTSSISEPAQRRWEKELIEFMEPLTPHEVDLINQLLKIAIRHPSNQSCEIIQFVKDDQS